MKCNETLIKWCKNKHGASKIMDTLETYQQLKEDLFSTADRKSEPRVTFLKLDLQRYFSCYGSVLNSGCLQHTYVHTMVVLKTI
jgi:hypothetical protein